MVERELLTPEILRERLAGTELREKFREALIPYIEKLPVFFTGAAEKLYPRALQGLVDFLQDPEIHSELEKRGHNFIDNTVLNLPPLQRFLVTSGQFDQGIHDKMPEIIDDLIWQLEIMGNNAEVRDRLVAWAADRLFAPGSLEELLNPAGEGQESPENRITEKLFNALESRMESILNAIDVRNLVSRRIDSLDMLTVEKIVLDVMADQFKWIDIFGGILGFLIGLFQASLSWFLR
jgi:hypothetical protein